MHSLMKGKYIISWNASTVCTLGRDRSICMVCMHNFLVHRAATFNRPDKNLIKAALTTKSFFKKTFVEIFVAILPYR